MHVNRLRTTTVTLRLQGKRDENQTESLYTSVDFSFQNVKVLV